MSIDVTTLDDKQLASLLAACQAETDRRTAAANQSQALTEAALALDRALIAQLVADNAMYGREWQQPTGAHDAYPVGSSVAWKGKVWESLIPANTTTPGSDPRWWADVTASANQTPDPGGTAPEQPAVPPWATGTVYKVGDLVTYEAATYRCIQAHTSQAGWTPPAVPALWGRA